MADVLTLLPDDEDLPRIAWQNQATPDGMSASSVAAGSAAAFAVDGRLDRTWRPAAGGTQTLTAQFSRLVSITCWCLYGHDLGRRAATVHVEVWDGSDWLAWGPTLMPNSTEAIYIVPEAAVATTKARLVVTATEPWRIAAWFVGPELIPPTGMRAGFMDPLLGRQRSYQSARGRDGTPLPGIVTDESCEGRIDLEHVPANWTRAAWYPFAEACDGRGLFFLRWNQMGAPCCCSQARFDPARYTKPGLVDLGLSCRMDAL